jgi:peptidoglycan/xylan/chitin deacetylase (PgdA/CDA1 family)
MAPEHSAGVPILMYHSISDDLDQRRGPYFRTVTSPARFRRHMSMLRARGVRALTFCEAVRQMAEPASASRAPAVVVTFDDGYLDFKTTAFPIMQEFGVSATVFVSTGYIGRPFIDGRPCMNENDIVALADQGVEFGSHTVTHPQLLNVSRTQMRDELEQSRLAMTSILGHAVGSFSYPFRFPSEQPAFTKELTAALAACGYRQGVTTTIGVTRPADPPYFQRRLPINDCDDDALFNAKLDGQYDWVRHLQSARKRFRARFGI